MVFNTMMSSGQLVTMRNMKVLRKGEALSLERDN